MIFLVAPVNSGTASPSLLGKVVVLTGAMIPSGFPRSDAKFNLGFAFAAVQILPYGVYIAMHGRSCVHNSYVKDKKAGRFVVVN